MRFDRERYIRNTEFATVATVGLLELARNAAQVWRLQAISTGTEFDAIPPLANFILDNTGDFPLGYGFTWLIKDFIPRASQRTKLNIATGIILGAGIALETLSIPGAHPNDLYALFGGVAAYRGIHWGLNRLLKTEHRS